MLYLAWIYRALRCRNEVAAALRNFGRSNLSEMSLGVKAQTHPYNKSTRPIQRRSTRLYTVANSTL
jgi:hypothetical protein